MRKILLEKRSTTFEPSLTWQVLPGEGGVAVAVCEDIDMIFQIDDGSPKEQVGQIMEAFGLLLNDLEESGELEQFFLDYGIHVTIQQKIYKPDNQTTTTQERQPSLKMSLEKLDIGYPSSKPVHV